MYKLIEITFFKALWLSVQCFFNFTKRHLKAWLCLLIHLTGWKHKIILGFGRSTISLSPRVKPLEVRTPVVLRAQRREDGRSLRMVVHTYLCSIYFSSLIHLLKSSQAIKHLSFEVPKLWSSKVTKLTSSHAPKLPSSETLKHQSSPALNFQSSQAPKLSWS